MYDLAIDEEWYTLKPQKAFFRKEQPFKLKLTVPHLLNLFLLFHSSLPQMYIHIKNWILQRNTVYLL